MTNKPLSEQIEQADASEFVSFARELAKKLQPDNSEQLKISEHHEWMHNFYYPFAHCLARKESHIAAAIMLAKAAGAYQYTLDADNTSDVCLWFGSSCQKSTHSNIEMALLAAIVKKVESE